MKRNRFMYCATTLLMGCCLFIASCSDDDEKIPNPNGDKNEGIENERVTTDEIFYANNFSHDILNLYYYWNKEIADDLNKLNPKTNTNPIKTVEEIRYHKGNKEIDKWTLLIDDMDKFKSGVAGVSKTYGYQPIVYRLAGSDELVGSVAFVYKDSPAAKVGLKRGDLILKINDKDITKSNYTDLFYTESIKLTMGKAVFDENGKGTITPTGKEINLTAIEMYEDPILKDSIYEVNGKKVGYLAYASFDLTSIPKLIAISKKFQQEGVKELILDLRYNGGGYVITENAMASMYAPKAVVDAKEVYEIESYNELVAKQLKKQGVDGITHFTTEYVVKGSTGIPMNYSTKDSNIGIDKVYGLITKNSASASEALLSGLMPYMDVELIGDSSHGKYCTGWMISAKDAYKKVPEPIKNWGMYVMVSIYQNAKKETPCMPDGLQPDVVAEDNPFYSEQLGDVNEQMLRAALTRAGKIYDDDKEASRTSMTGKYVEVDSKKNINFGKRILLTEEMPILGK